MNRSNRRCSEFSAAPVFIPLAYRSFHKLRLALTQNSSISAAKEKGRTTAYIVHSSVSVGAVRFPYKGCYRELYKGKIQNSQK